MKALALKEYGRFALENVSEPETGTKDVLAQVRTGTVRKLKANVKVIDALSGSFAVKFRLRKERG